MDQLIITPDFSNNFNSYLWRNQIPNNYLNNQIMKKDNLDQMVFIDFVPKQIVWAKVQGSPWWPAEISKIPNKENQFYKVLFFGEDTHALLEQRAVKNYLENYQQLSSKKAKKLQKAISIADELVKQRQSIVQKQRQKLTKRMSKTNYVINQTKHVAKIQRGQQKKPIKKQSKLLKKRRKIIQKKNEHKQRMRREQNINNQDQREDSEMVSQSESFHLTPELSEREIQQAEEHTQVDRAKIDKVQTSFLQIIQSIQQTKADKTEQEAEVYCILQENDDYFRRIKSFDCSQLSAEEFCQSKITRMLAYILRNTPIQPYKGQVQQLSQKIKRIIRQHLTNTQYYDARIKSINRTRTQKQQFARAVAKIVKKTYDVRKQLARSFGQKISQKLSPIQQKQFLASLKGKQVNENITSITTKASLDKAVEQILTMYQ